VEETFDAVILGAGAAGLMCALTAGARGKRVLVLEHLPEPGAKIVISGGGRCNFTNLEVAPERFLSANPHYCKSALSQYRERDFIALVEAHRIPYHEKRLGQLFCDGSARAIVAMLLAECAAARVELRVAQRIREVSRAERFRIETERATFTAPAVVIATGGLSIPKMGSTSFAYDVARRFGLKLIEPRPGLVPLTMDGATLGFCRALTGVAMAAEVTCGRERFRENLLFTHRGLSGPAILQISSYWRMGESVAIDFLPGLEALHFLGERKRARPRAELKTVLSELLPSRLAEAFAADYPVGPIANLPDRALALAASRLKRWEIVPAGSEGWNKAEVTVGGIDTAGLSSRTMAAHDAPGLYVVGEAVDVTGWLGGYNFQWAWSSGWCAGQAI